MRFLENYGASVLSLTTERVNSHPYLSNTRKYYTFQDSFDFNIVCLSYLCRKCLRLCRVTSYFYFINVYCTAKVLLRPIEYYIVQFIITLYTILDQTVKFVLNLVILARKGHNTPIFIALNLSKLELFFFR